MSNHAIGIDFGHSHIKIVEVQRRLRQIVLQRASLIPVPQGAMTGGLLVDADVLSEVLAEANPKHMRLNRVAVVAGITGTQVLIRNLSINEALKSDLTPLVIQEMTQLMRMNPEEIESYIFDYHLLPGDTPEKQDVVVVGMKRQEVDKFTRLLQKVRMAPHILGVEAFALPYAMPLIGRACYIEIGAEYTQIYVTSDSEYLLYRLVPVGTNRMDTAVAAAYGLSSGAAQELRRSKHIDSLMTEAVASRTALQRVVEELIAGIIQTFEFLRARQRASSITELLHSVMLCGGGALQPGLDQLLSEETGLPITLAKPLSGRPGADQLGEDILAMEPMFAGALGLALQGVDEV
jgi:type IV pilus assembly protein PilM